MKTLSRTFGFVVLGVTVIIVVASCCNFRFVTDTIPYYAIEIGHALRASRPPTIPPRTYVPWKNQSDFEGALAKLVHNGGKICICVLMSSRDKPYPHKLNNDCPSNYKCPLGPLDHIRTVKVTKSKTAINAAAGESAANDPNVTWRIISNSLDDVNNVTNTLTP
jgi:hypothetical protein